MTTGLVLEGGAMRGMFTAGVLDVFMDHVISADRIVGVSAGALFGVNLLSGQRGRVIRYNSRFNRDRHYLGLLPLLREGNIVSTKYAYEVVPHVLDPFDDEAYMRSGSRFHAVVTNIVTGEPEYLGVESVFRQMDVLRASGSLPFISRPVEINGRKYLDGGIADSIPFRYLAEQGCDKLIVVLTRHLEYRKGRDYPAAGMYRLRYPRFADQLENRHTRYNRDVETLIDWEKQGKVFVIRPSQPITIASLERDPKKLRSVYELGIRDAENRLDALREYLDK